MHIGICMYMNTRVDACICIHIYIYLIDILKTYQSLLMESANQFLNNAQIRAIHLCNQSNNYQKYSTYRTELELPMHLNKQFNHTTEIENAIENASKFESIQCIVC